MDRRSALWSTNRLRLHAEASAQTIRGGTAPGQDATDGISRVPARFCTGVDNNEQVSLLLALAITAAGAWPPQEKGGGTVKEVQTIEVTASRFTFEPATITVAKGDSVRLRLHSTDGTHGIAIRAFRVKALIPKTGKAVTVEFVADQAGTFDFT